MAAEVIAQANFGKYDRGALDRSIDGSQQSG
jgi:hypothetical protein